MFSRSRWTKYIKNVSLDNGAKNPQDKKSLTIPEKIVNCKEITKPSQITDSIILRTSAVIDRIV